MSARLDDRSAQHPLRPPDARLVPRRAADAGAAAARFLEAAPQPGADPVERAIFAARLALVPQTGLEDSLRQALRDCLAVLCDDPEALVRAAMAQALRGAAAAPRDVVLRLAHDCDAPVSAPILEGSPVLEEGDLIALVRDPPGAATRAAIAARPGLGPSLAAAITATADAGAIAVLLGNPRAEMTEETLHCLIQGARHAPSWQPLLVARAILPHDAALALGQYLTGESLAALAARLDLPSETRAALLDQIARRLSAAPPEGEDDAAAAMRARVLHTARLLTDGLVQQAALREEERFVLAALKIRSGVEQRVIDRVRERRDEAVVATLAARGGFGIACTDAMITLLGTAERPRAEPVRRLRQRYVGAPKS